MKWYITRKRMLVVIAIMAVVLVLFGLFGCSLWRTESESQGAVRERREYREEGVQAGQPFTKTGSETRTVETSETRTEKAGVDEEVVARAVQVGMAAATGDLRAAISALKTNDSFTGNQSLDTLIAGVIAYLGSKGGIAAVGRMRGRPQPTRSAS